MSFVDSLLDASIYFSFDRSGYARHAKSFVATDLDVDMSGRVCLVTGANSGIGFATARGLAARKATVVLLCRDEVRGIEARDAIARENAEAIVRLETLDVADLGSIRAFVARFREERVDVLVHNAGVLRHDREETADGIERTFATGVIGPFALTALLSPKLVDRGSGGGARVIWVASGGMYATRLDLGELTSTRAPYDGVRAYAQTKRAQVILAEMWAERLANRGISVNAMHPGWASTAALGAGLPRFHAFTRNRLRTPDEAADTVLWLAVAERAARDTGRFWFDRSARSTHLLPGTREERADRERLWSLCERTISAADMPR